ncbi:hypothetical protein M8J75_009963 [Diaphorina citri]|nr:hypothetical protein M8J75_009963 [Diaphorina citri]
MVTRDALSFHAVAMVTGRAVAMVTVRPGQNDATRASFEISRPVTAVVRGRAVCAARGAGPNQVFGVLVEFAGCGFAKC